MIMKTYAAPNSTILDVADSVNGGGLDRSAISAARAATNSGRKSANDDGGDPRTTTSLFRAIAVLGDMRVLCVFARIVAVGHRVNAGITSLANSSSDSREAAKTT
jgi:hypothetical protein